MPNESHAISIRFSDQFEENLYRLSKRYRSIRSDIEPVIGQLQAGNFPGDRIPDLGTEFIIYKVRIRNSNIQKGKSAGYRLIYQIESSISIFLLTIYSKSERQDISAKEILDILAEFNDY